MGGIVSRPGVRGPALRGSPPCCLPAVALLASHLALAPGLVGCTSPSGPDGGDETDPGELPDPDVRVVVDGSRSHQSIAGFGGDIGPWHFNSLEDGARNELLRRIVREMGVHSFRMNLVPYEGVTASDRWGANDNPDATFIDWSRFDFCARPDECNDEWAEMIPVLREAGAEGLYWGLIQGPRWNGFEDGSSFSVDEAVENQLAAYRHFREEHGIVVETLAPFSEPSGGGIDWPITADQARRTVERLGQRLRLEGFPEIRMIVPDAVSPESSVEYGRAILEDPAARRHVGALGFHAYRSGTGGSDPTVGWRDDRRELRELADRHGLPVRMTEFASGDGLLERANHIHNELAFAGSRTYHPQHVVSTGGHAPGGDVRTEAGAIVYFVPGSGGQVAEWGPTRHTGVAVGHYSRFVPPGAVRLGVDVVGGGLRAQAFRIDDPAGLAVVIINNGSAGQRAQIELEGGLRRQGDVRGIVTREGEGSEHWTELDDVLVSGDATVSLSVPARSVTSLRIPR